MRKDTPASVTILPAREHLLGAILGTAVGDSLGLPAEGLSPKTIQQRWRGTWRQRLVFERGMVSDDTEHTIMIAQSLIKHPDDADAFQRSFAWKLRIWFIMGPAGVGMATARACFKLWFGFSPKKSGVFSAGNGPAMRSAVIGARFPDDAVKRQQFVAASTRVTHTDPKAEIAALAVAEITAAACRGDTVEKCVRILEGLTQDQDWQSICRQIQKALAVNLLVPQLAAMLGLERGVTGYAYHTVPVAIYACLRHPKNYRAALVAALDCGGDTDSVGAIVGAISGASVGEANIPAEWILGILDWPMSVWWMRRVAVRLSLDYRTPVGIFWPALLLRNLLFLCIVICHGFRRLVPLYVASVLSFLVSSPCLA